MKTMKPEEFAALARKVIATAIKEAVAAENAACVEILIKRAKNASGGIKDFAEEVAQAIEAR